MAVTGLVGIESWWAPVSHFSGSNITYPESYIPNGTAPGEPDPPKLDPGVSTNRTWWKFWRLDHGSWPHQSNTTSSSSSPGTSSSRPSSHPENWFFSGFRLLAWGGSVRIFSRPGSGGILTLNGGWLLFLIDTFGVWMFGDWWPVVATASCTLLMALVAAVLLVLLHACSRLWCCRCAWSLLAPAERGQLTPTTSSEKFEVVALTGNHMIWSLCLRPAPLVFNWIRKGGRASTDMACGCAVTECWVLPPDEYGSLWKGQSKFIFVEAPTAREDRAFIAPVLQLSTLSHWSTSERMIVFRHGA